MIQGSPGQGTLAVTFFALVKTFDANISNISNFVLIAKILIYNKITTLTHQDQELLHFARSGCYNVYKL